MSYKTFHIINKYLTDRKISDIELHLDITTFHNKILDLNLKPFKISLNNSYYENHIFYGTNQNSKSLLSIAEIYFINKPKKFTEIRFNVIDKNIYESYKFTEMNDQEKVLFFKRDKSVK